MLNIKTFPFEKLLSEISTFKVVKTRAVIGRDIREAIVCAPGRALISTGDNFDTGTQSPRALLFLRVCEREVSYWFRLAKVLSIFLKLQTMCDALLKKLFLSSYLKHEL